jgi:hypothetical protein
MTTGSNMKMDPKKQAAEAAKKEAERVEKLRVESETAARKAQNKLDTDYGTNKGVRTFQQSAAEKKAGVNAQDYEGMRDIRTGKLLDQYKVDAFSGDASKKMRAEAMGSGPSEWAKAALQRQQFEQGQGADKAGLQQQTAQAAAQAQLARQGGMGGGARTSLARSGARDAMMAQQQNAAQGIQQRFGINETDTKRRQDLLAGTADLERQQQLKNMETMQGDVTNLAKFQGNRYNAQMQAWANEQSANATRAAGGGGGKK